MLEPMGGAGKDNNGLIMRKADNMHFDCIKAAGGFYREYYCLNHGRNKCNFQCAGAGDESCRGEKSIEEN